MKLPVLLSLSAASSIYAVPSNYDRAESIRLLKEKLMKYRPVAQQSRDNLSSLTSSVSKITSVLKDHAAKFESIEGNVEANSQTAARLTNKATQLEAAIVALTNAVTVESQRVDKNFKIVNSLADQEDYNNDLISENADDIEDVEQQVRNLAADLKTMKHDFTQYLDMNKVHLDNLIADFKTFISNTNPFYQKFNNVIDLTGKGNEAEAQTQAKADQAEAEADSDAEEEGSGAESESEEPVIGARSFAPANDVVADEFADAGDLFLEDFDDMNFVDLASEGAAIAQPWLTDSMIEIGALMSELENTLQDS